MSKRSNKTGKVCTTNPVTRDALRILKETGLDYDIQDGGRHLKVILAGKFIGVLSKCGKRGRDTVMLQNQIKRRVREVQCS